MFFSTLVAATTLCLAQLSVAKTMNDYKFERWDRAWGSMAGMNRNDIQGDEDTSDYVFLNKNTSAFRIKSLPDVNYNIGEMYGGEIPIDESDPSRTLFFIYKPAINADALKDTLTVYLNGGPGCSSLIAFLQENGPFLWQPGTYLPVANPYTWANYTNMLWVEQPVGTGFSQGKVTAAGEGAIAKQFVSWFKNFQQKFGISNYKIYMTGESYAGRYVPYISNLMLEQNNTKYYDLKGALIYDGVIGNFIYTQEEVMAYPFAVANQESLALNSSFMAQSEALYKSCGYEALVDKYLQFPPPGHQPALVYESNKAGNCTLFSNIYNAATEINPCFNLYAVNQQCPLLYDVLGFPTGLEYLPPGVQIYFNRTDVKQAIHAPVDYDWYICAHKAVIIGKSGPEPGYGDDSPDPIQDVLPKVIEGTNRVLVANGDLDYIIITNGTLMAIQNMTWGGQLGFQSAPTTPIYISLPDLQYASVYAENDDAGADGPQGTMGIQHFERGLMWAETYLSGHEGPEYQPRVSLRHLMWLLGMIDTL